MNGFQWATSGPSLVWSRQRVQSVDFPSNGRTLPPRRYTGRQSVVRNASCSSNEAALARPGVGRDKRRAPEDTSTSRNSRHLRLRIPSNYVFDSDTPAQVWQELNRDLLDVAKRGSSDDAIDMLRHLISQGRATPQNFSRVVSIVVHEERLAMAYELAAEVAARGLADFRTFRPLLRKYAALGMDNETKQGLSMMQSAGVDTSPVLLDLVQTFADNGEEGRARTMLAIAETTNARNLTQLFNVLLRRYSKTGSLSRAQHLLDHMAQHDVRCNDRTFNILLDGCARAGDLARAKEIASDMQQAGIQPGITTYNVLIRCYAQAGMLDQAIELFVEARRLLVPDLVTYNTIINACTNRGDMEMAGSFFEEMIQSGCKADSVTLTSLIKGFGKAGNVDKALELFEGMRSSGLTNEEHVYRAAIHACLANCNGSAALSVIQSALDEKLTVETRTWSWLLEVCVELDDEPLAIAVLNALRSTNGELDDQSRSTILSECRKRGGNARFMSMLRN